MTRPFPYALLMICSFLFNACSTATPEKCFDIAVLNSNMLTGFANSGMARELESPSVKMGKTKDDIIPMQRSEVLQQKIQFIEENLEKIKSLGQTEDSREIIENSLALHQFILPVLKTEYSQLAKLYDTGASKEQTSEMTEKINETYFSKFEALYTKLINSGKSYATKHGIEVKWND